MKPINQLISLLFATALLTACGGGGGSSTPPNVAPTANAGADQTVDEGTTVTLTGAGTDSDGSISSFAWTQVSGPTVALNNANAASASFTAPDLSASANLVFRLTVTDNRGATATDDIQVTVNPVSGRNNAPTANAGSDQNVGNDRPVTLSGSGTDSDGSIASYLWVQTGGTPTVTLTNANQATATFTAPAAVTTALTFQLTVTDNEGATATDTVVINVAPLPTAVTVSGKATYDRVNHNANNSLNLATPVISNVRGALVELLDSNNTVLQSTSTDASGNYSFSNVAVDINVKVRVKAQLHKTGTPSWDFQVVDNTSGKALYSMVSGTFNTGTSNQTQNLHAAVGTGTTYTNTRAAAPFAILDSVYRASQKVISSEPNFQFAALKLNWSVNNVATGGNKAIGQIGTSHFDGTDIYILGKADNDTDEFDGHVVIHEWGHYFEGFHSRSDSIGGAHGGGDKLDMRVAFGEGFGNALSGMVTDDPIYRDSLGTNSSQGFSINVETNSTESPGWSSEAVVQSILYDLYDSGTETGDPTDLGFTPILSTLTNFQRNTDSFTSIFSFVTGLKAQVGPSGHASINTLVNSRAITADTINEFATTEVINDSFNKALPVYVNIAPGGVTAPICSYASHGEKNKLGNHRYLKMTIATQGSYTLSVPAVSASSDPDFYVYQRGTLISGNGGADSGANVTETWTGNLSPGVYAIELHEFKNIDTNGTNNDESCFTVTLN